jgi:hypothetical protein
MTGVHSPMVDAVQESVSVADVVSDSRMKFPLEPQYARKNRGR